MWSAWSATSQLENVRLRWNQSPHVLIKYEHCLLHSVGTAAAGPTGLLWLRWSGKIRRAIAAVTAGRICDDHREPAVPLGRRWPRLATGPAVVLDCFIGFWDWPSGGYGHRRESATAKCVIFQATERFWQNFYDLPTAQKASVRQKWQVSRDDPFHPSLGTHKIHRLSALAHHTIYSVVIEGNLRTIFRIDRNVVTTLDVGDHDVYQ